ncbi:MAG: DUF3857 domain-containing protein [Lentisphaeria bacterium]|nr:DUF3857 domain-containing protein [Lentisphaeria bacterium]
MKIFTGLLAVFLVLQLWAAAQPEASVILLDDREEVTVNADGTCQVTDRCVYRILNYDGVKKMQVLPLHFNSAYGTIMVTHLATVRPDGTRTVLDPEKNSSLAVESSQMESAIFDPDQKVLSVTVPGLQAGDILEITTCEKITRPRMPGEFSDIAVLQADFPIKKYEYIIDMPADKPLYFCVKDEVPGTLTFRKTGNGQRTIYAWTAGDVPPAVPESAMPPMYSCVQRVLTSTVKSWEDISRWYDRLCVPHLEKVNPAMKEKTAELTAGKLSDSDKISALFQFVSQNIRYTGVTDEDTAPGYEPHDVDKTFNQRHGVCRDKAALLTSMLRLAGFKAYLVLFMSGSPKDWEIANIYFNHAIVAVEKADGEYTLMDPTFESTTELFPGFLAGFPYLVAKPQGDTLRFAPTVKAESNLLEIDTRMEKGILEMTLNFSGIYDNMYRDALSRWSADDIRSFFAAGMQKSMPGTELTDFDITPGNIRDMSSPLKVRLCGKTSGTGNDLSDRQVIQVPRGAFAFGMLDSLYTFTALDERRFPLQAMPRMVREKITLDMPNGISCDMPEAFALDEPGLFRGSGKSWLAGGKLNEQFVFAVDSMLIRPDDYGKFKSAVARAGKMWQSYPVSRKKASYSAEKSNAEILKHSRICRITDHSKWEENTTFSLKIHNYAGIKEHANVTVPWVEGVETLQISATITDSKGGRHQLAAKDIRQMDDPGNAAAPRYLKRKLSVVTFPGVDVGSVIDCTVKKSTSGHPFFYTEFLTMDKLPARLRELTIVHPARMKLKISDIPEGVQHSASFGGKQIIRRYSVENSPAVPDEPGQPPLELFVPSVRISSGNNSELFARIGRIAGEKARQLTPEITALARKIAADIPVPGAAVRDKEAYKAKHTAYAVEKFVYKHIRENPLPLNELKELEFSLPETILHDGYGSNADRAILMAAMLHALGIEYVFIPLLEFPGTGAKIKTLQEFPQNCYTRLLVQTEGHILNDSGLYGVPGVLRHEDCIVLDGQVVDYLMYGDSERNREVWCDIVLDRDLGARVSWTCQFYGSLQEREKERFARFTPALEKQYIEKFAAALSPQAKVVNWKFTPETRKNSSELSVTLDIPDIAVRTGKFAVLELPGFAMLSKLAALPAKKRQTPYLEAVSESLTINYSLTLPAGFRSVRNFYGEPEVHLSGARKFCFEGKITDSGKLKLRCQVKKTSFLVPPENFGIMLDIHRKINNINNRKILFTVE